MTGSLGLAQLDQRRRRAAGSAVASMVVFFQRMQFCAMAMIMIMIMIVASMLGVSAGLAVGVQGIAHKVASEKVPVAK